MSSRSKAPRVKSNSHKKLRKPICEVQDETKLVIQSIENKNGCSDKSSKQNRDSSICKSLENIIHSKIVNNDVISVSNTEISIVYKMYKTLLQKNISNNEAHVENYRVLINELRKLQSQLDEQALSHKSLVNQVTTLMSQRRLDKKMRRKKSETIHKKMILQMSQIASVVFKLQGSIKSLETTNSEALDSKIEPVTTANSEKLKKKKLSFCCCM